MSTTAADHKVDRIRAVPMFASASASTLELLAQSTDEVTVQPGKVLVTEGHLSHDAYVIESGTAEVLVDGEVVAEIPAGELIGELAFLDPGPSTATVRAQTRMDVLVIPHNRLDAIVAASPEMLRTMATELAARLRRMDARHREDTHQIVSLSIEETRTVEPPMIYTRPQI